jgi:hypothetical protein
MTLFNPLQAALNAPDAATYYTPGAKGYIGYPAMALTTA